IPTSQTPLGRSGLHWQWQELDRTEPWPAVEVVRHPPHPRGECVPHGDVQDWRDRMVLLATIATGPKGLPGRAAPAVGGGAHVRVALSEPALQQRLRAS